MARKNTAELPVIEVYQEDVPQEQSLQISNSAVALLSVTDEAINQLKEKYASLVITDINDKENYNTAKEGSRILVKLRNSVEKKRLSINRSVQQATSEEAKRITAELAPMEIHVKAEVDRIDKLKKEHEAREYTRKKKLLEESGFQFDGRAYVCGPQMIFADDIAEMPDADIESKCEIAREYIAEEARLAEEKRVADEAAKVEAENARIAAEEAKKQVEDRDKAIAILQAKLDTLTASNDAKVAAPEPPAETPAVEKQTIEGGAYFGGGGGSLPRNNSFLHKETPAEKPVKEWDAPLDLPLNRQPPTIDQDEAIFDAGYECFRKQVIEAFSGDHKLTRPQWVEVFKSLNSTENVKTTIARIITA